MQTSPILQPVVTLILWTMFMWSWMYATRIPAMRRAGIDVANMRGGKGTDLDQVLPEPSGGNHWAPLQAAETLKAALIEQLELKDA